MKYSAAVAILMLQTATAAECNFNIEVKDYDAADCSGEPTSTSVE